MLEAVAALVLEMAQLAVLAGLVVAVLVKLHHLL
jgi:hypothetical protein